MATEYQLIMQRLVSFGYSFSILVATTILGVLVSPDFAALVHANFGEGASATLILLVVDGVVKYLRNVSVLSKAADNLGSIDEAKARTMLI